MGEFSPLKYKVHLLPNPSIINLFHVRAVKKIPHKKIDDRDFAENLVRNDDQENPILATWLGNEMNGASPPPPPLFPRFPIIIFCIICKVVGHIDWYWRPYTYPGWLYPILPSMYRNKQFSSW